MRALLLAAGLGTRLRPLTYHIPKCLVPIHGRPLLDYWLEALLDNGVEEVLINTHYMASMVQEFLHRSSWRDRAKIVHEKVLYGTGGTVLHNRAFFRGETFLVAHADNLTIFDVSEFFSSHLARPVGTDMTMMLFETTDPRSCGIVELDARGVVQGFHEKTLNPPGNLANAAVYMLEPTILAMMDGLGKEQIDLSSEVIPKFMGRIATYRNEIYHKDIGTMNSWREANRDFDPPKEFINAQAWQSLLSKSDLEIGRQIEILSQESIENSLFE